MLDTHARRFVQPVMQKTANWLLRRGFSANQVTLVAFIIGLSASLFIWLGYPVWGVALLWFSGFLDAVDGSMARIQKKASAWGTIMDITFDRLVESGIIITLALLHPEPKILFLFLLLAISIIFSMTVFLTVGAVSERNGYKSFYYQAGLAERTEGFVLFSLMVLFQQHLIFWTLLFLIVETYTGMQRLLEARRMF